MSARNGEWCKFNMQMELNTKIPMDSLMVTSYFTDNKLVHIYSAWIQLYVAQWQE